MALLAAFASLGACYQMSPLDADTSADSGATDDGEVCDPPAPPSPTMPQEEGCYVNYGDGWVAVPCFCELWLENTTPGPATAGIELTVTPPEEVPTLTGTLNVEIAFDDPDASWYAIWTAQPGNGDAFTVTSEGGATTVRMGASGLSLGPVPLAACETRTAKAHVSGSYTATLSMHAVLDDGTVFAATDGSCSDIPPM
jgi:hypothetical protein